MKEPVFSGVCTALVTPFVDGRINYPMLEQLLLRQLNAGIQCIVICGTTGESPTLSDYEKLQMVKFAKEYVGSDCKIIAGTGSNSTEHAVSLSAAAEELGADALLVVSPYYNKATPDGLVAHYSAVASSVQIPVILYNVPSRTGVDISVGVYQELAKYTNIAGVKEASSDITKIARIRGNCPDDFYIWSGNDDQVVPVMSLGGQGIISVLSNVIPKQTNAMTQAALDGKFGVASALQIDLLPLIQMLFCEVNPIPVKAAMKLIGYDCGECRLPLTELTSENQQKLKNLLPKYKKML